MFASFGLQVDGAVATTHESDVHDHIHMQGTSDSFIYYSVVYMYIHRRYTGFQKYKEALEFPCPPPVRVFLPEIYKWCHDCLHSYNRVYNTITK